MESKPHPELTSSRRNDAADGVAARQQDSPSVHLTGRDAGRVEIRSGLGDQRAAAGWANGQIRRLIDLCMALPAELTHSKRLHLRARVDRFFIDSQVDWEI